MSIRIAAHVTRPHSNQLTTKLKNKSSCSSMIHQQMHNNPNVNVLFQKYTKQLLTYYHYNRPKKPYPADQLLNFQRSGPTSSGFTFLPGRRFGGTPIFWTSKIWDLRRDHGDLDMRGWKNIHVDCFFWTLQKY